MPTSAATKPPVQHPGEFTFVTNALQVEPPNEHGKRRFHTIMSSTIKDRAKNEVKLTALEDLADAFKAGLVIFRNHDYVVPDSIFGQSDSADIRDSGRVDKVGNPIYDLHVAGWVWDKNAKSAELADAIDAGIKVGASIGAWPINPKRNADGGLLIEHMEAGEGSIVGMPKNQRSLVQKSADAIMQTWSADIPLVTDDEAPVVEDKSIVDEITEKVIASLHAPTVKSVDEVEVQPGEPVVISGVIPPLANADLSSKARANLDSSQFACPEKRLYPIHDAAHVRAALSRVADPSNDQCGKEKILAAARRMGIGDHQKSSMTDEELLVWAQGLSEDGSEPVGTTETAEEPKDDSEPVTNSEPAVGGQEADGATPETAPAAAEDEPTPEVQEGETFSAADVAALVTKVGEFLNVIQQQNDKIATLQESLQAVTADRDRLSAEVPIVKEAVQRALALPLRPQAHGYVTNAVNRFPMFAPSVAASIQALTEEPK